MTKTKIKYKLKKIKTKTKNEMELRRHNNIKTMGRKMSQTVVKDTKTKDKAKAPWRGAEKKLLRSPHMIHNQLSSYERIIIMK